MSRVSLLAAILISLIALQAQASDIWVAGNGSNSTGDGSSSLPYRTITFAMLQAVGGDVIKVKTGTYNVAAGESFPIDVKHNVDIIGQEASQANWPRIGGDVNVSSSAVEALIRVQALGVSRTGIDVQKLYFLGENNSGKDGPGAFAVRVSGGGTAVVAFDGNYCERSAMGDSLNPDRATVLIEAGYGTTYATVSTCPAIYASARGSIELRNGTDTTSEHTAAFDVDILRNTMKVTGTDVATFGFAYIAAGEEWVVPELTIQGNTFDSSGATGSGGIQTGLWVSEAPEGGGDLSLNHEHFHVTGNTIKRCTGDGIWLRNVPVDGERVGYIGLWDFERNVVRDCLGSALLIQKSETGSSYAGYVTVQSRGNLFVKNTRGIKILADYDGGGQMVFINDTIADNTSYGIQLVGANAWITGIINGIVYGNNGGNPEYDGGASGWSPTGGSVTVEYCDFEGIGSGEGNISSNPYFMNPSAYNYHLNPSYTPCIDAGDNLPDAGSGSPLIAEFDYDGDDRVIDGDADSTATIDMGADEYEP